MPGQGRATDWIDRELLIARCPDGHRLQGAEQPNGIWCEASLCLYRRNPRGQEMWVATCLTSAQLGTCKRPHLYVCDKCQWEILIE